MYAPRPAANLVYFGLIAVPLAACLGFLMPGRPTSSVSTTWTYTTSENGVRSAKLYSSNQVQLTDDEAHASQMFMVVFSKIGQPQKDQVSFYLSNARFQQLGTGVIIVQYAHGPQKYYRFFNDREFADVAIHLTDSREFLRDMRKYPVIYIGTPVAYHEPQIYHFQVAGFRPAH